MRWSMTLAHSASNKTVETREDLVAYLASGCKPEANWMLGTEHEKFGYTLNDLRPLPYSGNSGINAILTGLADEFDWRPVMENGLPIALLDDTGQVKCYVTPSPGLNLRRYVREYVSVRGQQRQVASLRATLVTADRVSKARK